MNGAEEADRVELAARARALTEALQTGRRPAGRLLGLPELPDDDYWLDTAGVTALTGIRPKTISSWLARGGPVRNPFPVPQRFLYRLYWRGASVLSWLAKEPDVPKGRTFRQAGMAGRAAAYPTAAHPGPRSSLGYSVAVRLVEDAGGGADVHVEGGPVVGVTSHPGHVGRVELPGEQGRGAEDVAEAVPHPPPFPLRVAPAGRAVSAGQHVPLEVRRPPQLPHRRREEQAEWVHPGLLLRGHLLDTRASLSASG